MSYARFGPDSDLYVFWNTGDFYECQACSLVRPDPMVRTGKEMADHVAAHRAAGHRVPEGLEDDLREASP